MFSLYSRKRIVGKENIAWLWKIITVITLLVDLKPYVLVSILSMSTIPNNLVQYLFTWWTYRNRKLIIYITWLCTFLHQQKSLYNTRRCQNAGSFLVVPKFQPSVHKSSKQFGYSFAFDAPTLWNALPDDIQAALSVATFRRRLKTYLYNKAYPP